MPKKTAPKPPKTPTPPRSGVAALAPGSLPKTTKRTPAPHSGVAGARKPSARAPSVSAMSAGEACKAFAGGGQAFMAWLRQRGEPATRRPRTEWLSLLDEFASRAIHGHRRGPGGGNHRPNRSDAR